VVWRISQLRGRVVVDDEKAFQTWLSTKPTYAETAARVAGDLQQAGRLRGLQRLHGPEAQVIRRSTPEAAQPGRWYLARQLRHFKEGVRGLTIEHVRKADDSVWLRRWLTMQPSTCRRYITSLPDGRPSATLIGDPERAGRSTRPAQPVTAMLARVSGRRMPPAGEHERLVSGAPAAHFKQGIRGTHHRTFFPARKWC